MKYKQAIFGELLNRENDNENCNREELKQKDGIGYTCHKEERVVESYLKVVNHNLLKERYEKLDKELYQKVMARLEMKEKKHNLVITWWEGNTVHVQDFMTMYEYLYAYTKEAGRKRYGIKIRMNRLLDYLLLMNPTKRQVLGYNAYVEYVMNHYIKENEKRSEDLWLDNFIELSVGTEEEQRVCEYIQYVREHLNDIKRKILLEILYIEGTRELKYNGENFYKTLEKWLTSWT